MRRNDDGRAGALDRRELGLDRRRARRSAWRQPRGRARCRIQASPLKLPTGPVIPKPIRLTGHAKLRVGTKPFSLDVER